MSSRRSLGVAKMAGVALAAFGFAFALVPLYRIACEKVFGVRLEQGPQAAVEYGAAHGALAMTTPGDTSMVRVEEVEAAMKGKGARVIR